MPLQCSGTARSCLAGSSDFHGECDDMGNSCNTFALVRLNDDGSLDHTFGSAGKVVTLFVTRQGTEQLRRAEHRHPARRQDRRRRSRERLRLRARPLHDARTLDATFGRGGKVLTDFASG